MFHMMMLSTTGRVIKYTGDVKTVFALKNAIELFFLMHDHPVVVIHIEDRKEYMRALVLVVLDFIPSK